MCHSVIFTTLFILSKINAETTSDHHGYTSSNYAPSTANFNEVYTNNLDVSDDPSTTKEEFHISNIPSQLVEFHQQPQTDVPATPPPPVYILNTSLLNQKFTNPSTTSTTTEDVEDNSVKDSSIKKDFQRGVLDLLFPATRVRTFKGIFDSVRRILSHTFRK